MSTAVADPTTPAAPVAGDPAPAAVPPVDPAAPVDPTPAPAPGAVDPIPAAPVVVDYELEVPQNSLLRDTTVTEMTGMFKAMGLSKEQAQARVQAVHEHVTALAASYMTALKADPTIGGANYDDTIKHAEAGMAWGLKDAPDDEVAFIKNLMNSTASGNHKAIVRFFAKVGRGRAEDTPVGGGRAPTKDDRSFADRFYEPKA